MKLFTSVTDKKLAQLLLAGGIGVLPTDTVYGLVCRAQDRTAVERMYSLKQRERQPGTTIAANIEQLHDLGFSYQSLHIADRHWPAPLSVVLDARHVPAYLKTTLPDLPVRIPNDAALLELLKITGPLMTTSANAPKAPTATNIEAAKEYFDGHVDFYVDAGELGNRPPSTIVRITDAQIEVLRHGAFKITSQS